MNPISDAEILLLIKTPATKDRGFRLMMEKYQEKLYWQIRRMMREHEDTNDVLQNVLIKVWNAIDGFKEESQLTTWLYRIAYNESINLLTQNKKMKLVDWETSISGISNIEKEEHNPKKEFEEALMLGIESLPGKQKLIFKMRYFDELSYEQMSVITGTSVGGLKASYHHAIKKLEIIIKSNLNQN